VADAAAADPARGWVAAELAAEFPELALFELTVPARDGRSSRELRARLRALAGRWTGSSAVELRTRPVPSALRVFHRQVGLDPDAEGTRTAVEELVRQRLLRGGFPSRGAVADACLVATVETGVPVGALDDALVDGPLGIRTATDAERLGEGELADELPAGRLVLADADRALAVLLGGKVPVAAVSGRTTAVRLFCVRVPGVPEIHATEALWVAAEALAEGTGRR
jgi:DNA/RNA-binding domain of Phe-tRNA-synthetase-like protein